jgi:4-hydroxy-2-oxoheptanedioate aldolase
MNLTLQSIPSTIITEVLCRSKLDGVVLDTEHGYFNNETLVSCIQIATSLQKKCFVRFTDLNKQLIRMCLDAGADGAIFSTIESAVQGKQMIDYCNYPCHNGSRGCALVRENMWGQLPVGVRKPIIIGQIETKNAVDNIQEILACPFDGFLIGPYDLSSSLGCPADWKNQVYLDYMDTIYRSIPQNKLGAFLPSKKDIQLFMDSHRSRPWLLVWGLDINFIMESVKDLKLETT